jgi:hypothetical protein
MTADAMRHALQVLAAGALTSLLCACVTRHPGVTADAAARGKVITAELAAASASLLGNSKADVIAALGPATVLRFDSGYEVWVYRFVESPRTQADARSGASAPGKGSAETPSELVLLFTPTGVVAKTRVRFAPPNATAGR